MNTRQFFFGALVLLALMSFLRMSEPFKAPVVEQRSHPAPSTKESGPPSNAQKASETPLAEISSEPHFVEKGSDREHESSKSTRKVAKQVFEPLKVPRDLKEFKNLISLAVLTKAEQEHLQRLLQNHTKIRRSLRRLRQARGELSKQEVYQRMVSVTYLKNVLASSLERGDQSTANMVMGLISNDDWTTIENLKTKRVIAGDKIELFSTLFRLRPELANRLISEEENSINRKVFEYAKQKI